MRCSLNEPRIRTTLERLHKEAEQQREFGSGIAQRIPGAIDILLRRDVSTAAQAERHKDLYLSISREQGIFAYLVGRSINAHRIVEFGTSFGVSTIYLAAAVKDNGGGLVIGSEIEGSKVQRAQSHLDDAGLSDYVNIRQGDARRTLADPGGAVDMVLMDGAKRLYLPIIKMLTPHLRHGAVVLADNVCHFKKTLTHYRRFVRDITNGFRSTTLPFRGGFEYSVWLGLEVPVSRGWNRQGTS